MASDQEKKKDLEIKVSDNIIATDVILVKATPVKGESTTLAFDDSAASPVITGVSSGYLGDVEPAYKEIITETVERSKWIGADFRFAFEIPKLGKLEFEKKPSKEVKTTEKVIWNPHKK